MKIMNFKRLGKRALSLSLLLTLITVYSMVALAGSTKPVGELIVTGGKSDGVAVTVNGEPAASGRTVFSSSTITTPEGMTAVLNMGKAGKIELSPDTTFMIDGDDNAIGGSLTAGSVTLLNSTQSAGIRTLSGETVTLNSGETASATSARAARDHRDATGKCIDDDKDGKLECGGGGLAPWAWALIVGGAVLVVILVATSGNNNNVTSPVR